MSPWCQAGEPDRTAATVHPTTLEAIPKGYGLEVWQRYASPVWFDIDQTNVLNYRTGKGREDERHICPLQLDVIERSIELWTNLGDFVLDPFNGIGSSGVVALKTGRRYLGIELKDTYCQLSCKHLEAVEKEMALPTLFDALEPDHA